MLLVLMTTSTARAASPKSWYDYCFGTKYGVYVKGWAYDPDAAETSIDVHAYVFTDAACTNRYGDIHVLKADLGRADVNDTYGITGDHGFAATIPIADAGTYWVKLYAIDTGGDGNPQIRGVTQVTVTTNQVVICPSTTDVTLVDGDVLTGTGGKYTNVSIADGATVTLSSVDITDRNQAGDDTYSWAGLTCLGDAVIVLADGTINKVKGGYYIYPGILISEGYTLTIRGSGALEAYSGIRYGGTHYYAKSCGIGGKYQQYNGNIIIESGNITAKGSLEGEGGPGIGSYSEYRPSGTPGNITITGGTVTAIGGAYSAGIGSGDCSKCGNISITGGIINATGGAWAAGIGCGCGENSFPSSCGTITIGSGVTSVTATRGVTAEGYESQVNIIGKGYKSNNVTINISGNLIDVTEGYTRTLWGLALADNDDNAEAIGHKDGQTIDVQLRGRTLYKDGDWNTLCLPFDVSDFTGTPLAGATVMELDLTTAFEGHTTGVDGEILYLYFKTATSITAGKPYLIKWASGDPIVDPVFSGVTISSTTPKDDITFSGGKFVGQYNLFPVEADNTSVLNIGSGNAIGYAMGRTLRPFRAHFELSNSSSVKGCVMSFGDDGTSISLPLDDERRTKDSEAWYTLDGRKLEGKPTQKGIYINNGLKVIVK